MVFPMFRANGGGQATASCVHPRDRLGAATNTRVLRQARSRLVVASAARRRRPSQSMLSAPIP